MAVLDFEAPRDVDELWSWRLKGVYENIKAWGERPIEFNSNYGDSLLNAPNL
jgi:hypothetical protein